MFIRIYIYIYIYIYVSVCVCIYIYIAGEKPLYFDGEAQQVPDRKAGATAEDMKRNALLHTLTIYSTTTDGSVPCACVLVSPVNMNRL